MIKSPLFATLFFFLSLTVAIQAQIATISDPISMRQEDTFEMVGRVGESLIVVKDQLDGGNMYAFDAYMKLRWTQNISAEKKRYDIIGTIVRPKYFGVVLKYKIKGSTIIQLHKYDEAGELVDSMTVKDYGKRPFAPTPRLSSSADHRKFTIWSDTEDDLLEATSFDIERMEMIWDDRIPTGRLSLRKDLFQVVTDNKGNFYTIFTKDNLRAQKDKNRFVILQRTAAGRNTINIPLQSNLIYDSFFKFDNINQQIVAGGLYDGRKSSRAKGRFYLRCPIANPENHTLVFEKFDTDFMTSIIGKEVDEDRTFSEAYVNDIVLRSDGGIVLITERYRKLNQVYDPSFPRSAPARLSSQSNNQAEYHYDDILLCSIGPDGKTDWQDVLYKRQYSRDDSGDLSSFFIMKSPSVVRFIYNDEIKPNASISEYILLRGGENQRNNVLDTDGYGVRLMFRSGIQVNKNEIVVPSIRKRTLKLIRIKYG